VYKFVIAPTTLPDTPALEYILAAAEAGFDAVGLRLNRSPGLPFHPVAGNAPLIRDIKSALKDHNLPLHDIFSCYLLPDTRIEDFFPALDLGAELGGKYVMMMGNDPDPSRLRENYERFCDAAAQRNLTVVIEFQPTHPLATLPIALKLIADGGRKNAAICFDPLHFTRTGGTAADVRAVDRKLLPYIQFTDGILPPGEPDPSRYGKVPPSQRTMLGKGNVKLKEMLDAVPEGIALSVEIPIDLGAEFRDVKAKPYSAREWAKVALQDARSYTDAYLAEKKRN
jgi:sugar phosphate isomerase/epimerase